MSRLGELQCVHGQVVQDLPQPGRVTEHLGTHVRRKVHTDGDTLARSRWRDSLGDNTDNLTDVHHDTLERQSTGLNLGHVQHIVNDGQHHLGRPGNTVHVLTCLCRQLCRRQEEISVQRDTRQWVTQLVRHDRDEARLDG